MPIIHRTALLPYPAHQVFELVWDVASYPQFLPWCRAASILDAGEGELVAELDLNAPGISERFTTHNRRIEPERIELHLVSGPFERFEGAWHFKRLGDDEGCKVALELDFELIGAQALVGRAFSGFFLKVADRLVDAFCERANTVLGGA